MSNSANRVIKNTGYLYAKMAITMFISLYTTRLILNTLGASDFGIFNIVGGAIAMLGFLNAAMASATQRFMSYTEGEGNKEKQKYIFNISIILHSIIAGIIIIVLLIAGYFFFNGILNIPSDRIFAAKIIYGSLIISTVLTVMNVPYDAVMNAHENMKYYAIIGIIESILKLFVAITCVYTSCDKLILYGILMACVPLITLNIMKIYCHRKYEECTINLYKYWDRKLLRNMITFASWNLFTSTASMITNSCVGIIMNNFFGTVINAAQGIANQICGQLLAITNSMTKAVNPVIMKTEGAKDHAKVLKISATSSKLTYFLVSFLALPSIVTMPVLLKYWLKNVPDYAVFFAQCQLIISLCEQMTSGYNSAITASGKIKGISISKSVLKFLYLPLSYIIFKSGHGIIIAYYILVLIQGVLNGLIIPIYYLDKQFKYDCMIFVKKTFIPIACISGIIIVIDYGIAQWVEELTQLVCVFSLSIPIYIILFYILVLNKQEKALAYEIANKIMRRKK
jgi:O-antigen/teichoic acid export membrane protein